MEKNNSKAQDTTPKTEKLKEEKPKKEFPRDIEYIAIHCSAGNSDLEAVRSFWKNVLGWKSPGYHLWVDFDGSITEVLPIEKVSNGVGGFNAVTVNICYRGGVVPVQLGGKKRYVGKDTRTEAQKEGIIKAIKRVKAGLKKKGVDTSKIKIQGHRDFSPDKNGNGVVDSWERIKECPSYDCIGIYENL